MKENLPLSYLHPLRLLLQEQKQPDHGLWIEEI